MLSRAARTLRRAARSRRRPSDPVRRKSVAPRLSALEDEFLEQSTSSYHRPSVGDAAVLQQGVEVDEEELELRRYNELYRRQVESEEESLEKASADYATMVDELMKLGKGAELKPVQALLASWYEPLCDVIVKERNLALAGAKAEDIKIYGPLLLLLPPEQLAVLTMHHVLGHCLKHGDPGAKYSSLVTALGEAIQVEARVLRVRQQRRRHLAVQRGEAAEAHNEEAAAALRAKLGRGKFLDAKALAKLPQHVVNARAKRALEEDDAGDADWPTMTRAKLGGVLVTRFLGIAVDEFGDPLFEHDVVVKLKRKVGVVRAAPELLNLVRGDPYLIQWAATPRFLPMLVEPKPWRGFNKGGFLRLRAAAMRTHGCEVQREAFLRANAGLAKGVLSGLDAMGRVPWAINSPVLDLVQEAWAKGGTWPDLPSQHDIDISEFDPAPYKDEEALSAAKEVHGRRAAKLRRKNAELHSLRCDTMLKLDIAERFRNDAFYFPYNVDFRGRAYPLPPNLNHLGSDVCRAVLTFAESKRLGEDGLYWLRIHLANLFGLAKRSLDDRHQFALDNAEALVDSFENPMTGKQWWLEAEEPWQALAAIMELGRAGKLDDPTDYLCSLPVHMDGSCNGLQHYAALGRDREGGKQVNLVPGPEPRDVYEGVRSLVAQKIAADARSWVGPAPENAFGVALDAVPSEDDPFDEEVLAAEDEERAKSRRGETAKEAALRRAQIVDGLVTRKVVKQTVMTSVYGVTFVGARQQVLARLQDILEDLLTHPKDKDNAEQIKRLTALGAITPEGDADDDELYHCACYIASLTLEVLEELFTSARQLMAWMAQCARLVAQHDQPVSWITPLGLPVVQPYRRDGQHAVRTLAQTVVLVDHSDKLPVSVTKQKSAFPPNYVHSLDSTHMLMTANEMEHRGLRFAAVHDSYWTHACDVPVMNDTLRRQFLELYEAPLLEQLLESFQLRYPGVEFPPLPPRGDLDVGEVLEADYFFS